MEKANELSRWSMNLMGYPLARPYILDRGALHACMMTMCT
jgi:hypothetical protein